MYNRFDLWQQQVADVSIQLVFILSYKRTFCRALFDIGYIWMEWEYIVQGYSSDEDKNTDYIV